MTRRGLALLLLAFCAATARAQQEEPATPPADDSEAAPQATLAQAPVADDDPLRAFAGVVDLLAAAQGRQALQQLQTLNRRFPDFKLGHDFGRELRTRLASGVRIGTLEALTQDAQLRLASERASPAPGLLPAPVLQLADTVRHLVLVDLANARLYLFAHQNQQLQLLSHHYAAMGSNGWGKQLPGDRRTPLGIYQTQRWRDDADLPPLYGAGAFPLDYPNAWDRLLGRGGSGIWLHGVPPQTETRPPRSSEGCVTMANADLRELHAALGNESTPVVLSDGVQWLAPDALSAEREAFLQRLEAWRQAWTSLDTDAYLSFYAEDFTAPGMDRAAFAAYKQRVNAQKARIDVQLSDVSVFRYPGADAPMLLVQFNQHYRSDNYNADSRKLQFWTRSGDGEWQILREEAQDR